MPREISASTKVASPEPGVERPEAAVPQLALLQAIIGSAMDAIVALDDQQRIVLFNQAAEVMFRCKAEEALGQPLDRFLPAQFRAIHRHHVESFGATGDTSRSMGHLAPLTAVRGNGDAFPIEATISHLEIDGRRYYAAIVRDVTARQEAETSLRRQAELLDLAYDAILVWDWSGGITFWNRGAERLYGFPSDTAVGQSSHALLRTRCSDGLTVVFEQLDANGYWEGEFTQTRRDGTDVVVESRLTCVRNHEDRFVLEANRDVSARKAAEVARSQSVAREVAARAEAEAAAATRDQLQVILDDLPGGVLLMTAPDAHVEFASSAMLALIFGPGVPHSKRPVYGTDFRFMHHDGTPMSVEERPGVRAIQGERVRNLQLLLQRVGAEPLPISVNAAPLRDDNGESHRALVFVQDVSQLRQAEQLKDDFLALVSHELRTPLSAIHGGAHMLSTDPNLDEESQAELLADVVAESDRLDHLLGNLLTLVNVQAGRLHPATEPVLVAPLAREISQEVGARSLGHTFVISIPAATPAVEADPDLLEEVLRNLYENAVKYSPGGGMITTTARRNEGAVSIHVTDDGVGIAPEHVHKVFERFRRVGGDPSVRGMGLGLYLSRCLVEAQDGSIDATSPGLGHGASFTVTLPIARGWTESTQLA